jgi:hypothetical protein
MHRRVVFALPVRPLSGTIMAYGTDATPAGKPSTRVTGESVPRAASQQRVAGAPANIAWKEFSRTRW